MTPTLIAATRRLHGPMLEARCAYEEAWQPFLPLSPGWFSAHDTRLLLDGYVVIRTRRGNSTQFRVRVDRHH